MDSISFAWTTKALPCYGGKKCVTRRCWSDKYARRFRPGVIVMAISRQFRFGGLRLGTIRILSCERESILRLVKEPEYGKAELIREGGLWNSVEEFAALFTKREKPEWNPYRVAFEWIGAIPAKDKKGRR